MCILTDRWKARVPTWNYCFLKFWQVGKRARGRQRKTFWTGCQLHAETDGQESRFWRCAIRREEHQLIANVRFWYALQHDRTGSNVKFYEIFSRWKTQWNSKWKFQCKFHDFWTPHVKIRQDDISIKRRYHTIPYIDIEQIFRYIKASLLHRSSRLISCLSKSYVVTDSTHWMDSLFSRCVTRPVW